MDKQAHKGTIVIIRIDNDGFFASSLQILKDISLQAFGVAQCYWVQDLDTPSCAGLMITLSFRIDQKNQIQPN